MRADGRTPLRGAWIEISGYIVVIGNRRMVAPRSGVRGLKFDGDPDEKKVAEVAPRSGVRGLKWGRRCCAGQFIGGRTPLRGAWIEIQKSRTKSRKNKVAPRSGVRGLKCRDKSRCQRS